MLILAAVTITVAMNGGLFQQANDATIVTDIEQVREQAQGILVGLQIENYETGLTEKQINDALQENEQTKSLTATIVKDIITITGMTAKRNEIKPPIVANNIRMGEEDLSPTGTTTTEFSRAIGVIEIVWLNLNNGVVPNPLIPAETELTGLIPVKWEESTESETTYDDNGWYSYTAQIGDTTNGGTSKWANVKTNDGNAYFVWIPRYAYKIIYFDTQENAEIYRANNTSTTGIIGYSNKYGMVNLDGELVEGTEKTIAKGVTTAQYKDYIPHPAFQNGTSVEYKNGEWDEDIKGIWVGKFESSGSTSTVKIVPGVSSLRNTTIGNQYAASQTLKTTYSLAHDSHQMKNSEWRSNGILNRK
jgi:hypothetical protein